MARAIAFSYGAICYIFFLLTFLYAIGFVGNIVVLKGIDSGTDGPIITAIIVNVILMGIFAVQHSVMARPVFKGWWTQFVPEPVERSTYVLFSNLALFLLFWQWRPMTGVIWEAENTAVVTVLWALFALGWLLVLVSTFMIDHLDLFGMRQVYLHLQERTAAPPEFKVTWFYKFVRHPLLLGFIIAFWATPRMTAGHLLFAVVTTAYILIAIQLEERDLIAVYGDEYRDYRRRVSMIIPGPTRS